jgi:hypothetical protein
MSIPTYLESSQAREDVRALLDDAPKLTRANGRPKPAGEAGRIIGDSALLGLRRDGAWTRIRLSRKWSNGLGWDILATAYHRPYDNLFAVSDLGEGWRAHRLRTGRIDWTAAINAGCDYDVHIVDSGGELSTAGDCESMATTAADLPDAICRVLLASWKVANLDTESPAPRGGRMG